MDADLASVGPVAGCDSSYRSHYYGAGGPHVDPACHPGATGVQSLRHSHYGKDRFGLTLDEEWFTAIGSAGNTLRTGIWFEGSRRFLGRDWHRILDPSVDYQWDENPYWLQYEWDFPQTIFKCGAYFNAGGIDTSGFELSATMQVTARTAFYTAYTLNNSVYVGTGDPLVDASQSIVPGSDVTGVPAKLWVVSLDRTGPVAMGLTGKYTSARRVSLTADWYADAYWLVDAYLTFSLESVSDRLASAAVSLVANNLLDASYLSAIVENAAWIGAPRTVAMNVTVAF